jgi:hypothetical protein
MGPIPIGAAAIRRHDPVRGLNAAPSRSGGLSSAEPLAPGGVGGASLPPSTSALASRPGPGGELTRAQRRVGQALPRPLRSDLTGAAEAAAGDERGDQALADRRNQTERHGSILAPRALTAH